MQRQTLFSTTRAATRVMLTVLLGAALAVAAPVRAEPVTITGIASGQVVTQPVVLGATGDPKTVAMTLQLVGPGGYTRIGTSDGDAVSLRSAPGGGPAAWDPGAHPAGKYVLTAMAQRSARGSGRLVVRKAWFMVERPTEATPASPVAATEAVLGFASSAPARFTEGGGRAIDLAFDGTLPGDGDVMLLCWDVDRRRLVPAFTSFLKAGPWRIGAAQLNRLPAGRMELQAHLRRGGRVVQSARHPVQIAPFVPVTAPQPAAGPTTVYEGVTPASATGVHETVGGGVGGGDTVRAGSPPRRTGPADGPAGDGGSAPGTAGATAAPGTTPGTPAANATPRSPGTPSGSGPRNPPDPRVTPESPVVPTPRVAPESPSEPTPRVTPESPSTPEPRISPAPPSKPARPVPDEPVVVVQPDRPADLPVTTPADLPRDGVVEVSAWSINESRLVHPFAHTLDGSSMVISADRLRLLPPGRVELQFTPVVDGERLAPTFRTISVADALGDAGDDGLPVASGSPIGRTPVLKTPEAPATPEAGTPPAPKTTPAAPIAPAPPSRPSTPIAPTSPTPSESTPAVPSVPEATPPTDPAPPATPEPAPETSEPPAAPDVDLNGLDAVTTGFTAFAPSADTRTIYVAAAGNDANAGTSPSAPVRTMARARDLIRDGKPDHVRFKAGDTFGYGLGVFNKSGRSADEPIVLGVYGDGPRPKFDVPEDNFLTLTDNHVAVNNVVVQGLHAEAAPRNPHRAGFRPNAADRPELVHKQRGIFVYGDVSNVLIEDCVMDWFKDALVFQGKPGQNLPIRNLTLRRCILTNSYSVKEQGHSQGMYAEYVFGLTLEENFFDHNGWCDDVEGAQRTKFNHNVYVQYSAQDVELTGNVFSRGASHGAQVRPGGQVINNLFVRNALATFVAKSASVVAHNVILQADDISADVPRGYGIEVLPGPDTKIINNVLSTRIGSAYWAEPIGLSVDKNDLTKYTGPTRVELTDNKIYRWPIEYGTVLPIRYTIPGAEIVEARNAIDIASGSDRDPAWVDPSRNVESYMGSLQRDPSLEAFAGQAAARPRGQWLPELSAAAVNTYVRRGFDVQGSD